MPSPSRITPDRVVFIGALLAALAYIRDIRYDFILDDVPLILMDQRLTAWWNWKALFVMDISSGAGGSGIFAATAAHYRPIYKLWQMLNAQVFGLILPWWHITSLLLHIAVVFLVYFLAIKLLNNHWTAALAALLFAFHPIHAESVAYVTASTDLLVTLFALLSFLAYFRYRDEQGSLVFYFGSIVTAALAMLSKETAVMFPWLLVAYELLRESPSETPAGPVQRWKQLAWTLPFGLVVGVYAGVRTLLFGLNAGPGPGGSRLAALLDIPLVLVIYLRNLFWPFRLSFFYPREWATQWTGLKAAAVILVTAMVFFLWRKYGGRSGMKLQLVWTAILLLPAELSVYALVPEDWVHDRQMYFASVPICFAAAVLLTNPKWPLKFSIFASSAVLAILLISLAIQVPRFSDDATIYASALKVAPRSVLAHKYYAEALWSYGRRQEGLREFQVVTELAPSSSTAHERFGAALAEIGRNDDALAEYEWALHGSPGPSAFRAFLLSESAEVELKRSKFSEAAVHMREAIQIAPETLNYHALLAQALSSEGRAEEAAEEMRLEAGIRQRAAQEQVSLRYASGL